MTYKIVVFLKTRGQKKIKSYAFVPEKWEQNGFVYWPTHNSNFLRKSATSVPDLLTWTKYKAIVRKSNINTLDEAILLEDEFVNGAVADSTDYDTDVQCSQTKSGLDRKCPNDNSKYSQLLDSVHENNFSENIEIEENDSQSYQSETTEIKTTFEPEIVYSPQSNPIPFNDYISVATSADLLEMKNDINEMKEMLNKTTNEIQVVSLTMERIYDMIKKMDPQPKQNLNAEFDHIDYDKKSIFPISDCESLQSFDNYLREDNDYKSFIIHKFSRMIGEGKDGDGNKLSRNLTFLFFTSGLLNLYSWTGISRTVGTSSKLPFQVYECVIDIFTSIILNADDRWCQKKTVEFLKNKILRHTKQIHAAKQKVDKNFAK